MTSQNDQTDLVDQIRQLQKVCAELYRVIGSLAFVCPPASLDNAGITPEDLKKALDRAKNAAEGNQHKSESLLPWPASTRPEAQNETVDTPKQGERDEPHHKLSWWTENFFEAGNVRGVQFLGVFPDPPDRVWEVVSAYVVNGILMIAIIHDGVVHEVPADLVVPAFKHNHRASGRRDEKDEDELEDMIALAKERLINEMEETEDKPVDPTPANPRTAKPS